MKRILIVGAAALSLVLLASACTPEDFSRGAISQNFGDVEAKALQVAECESGLDPTAVSPSGASWGLFQINRVHEGLVNSLGYSWSQITDPFVNAEVARVIYNRSGWSPWACG